MEAILLADEAATRELRDDLPLRPATARDDIEGAGQSVPPEDGYRPPDQLDPLNIVEWQKVEVDLLDAWLVHPDAINKNADPLGDTGHRRPGEASE